MLASSIRSELLRRKKLLAVAIVAAGGFVAPDVHASTWTVNSCADTNSGSLAGKSGTLKFAAQNAGNGDTVDLSQLPGTYGCSTITLKTGAVEFAQNSLTLKGIASSPIAITGKYCNPFPSCTTEPDRIIKHTGTGTLDIYGVSLQKGYLTTSGSTTLTGGCVYSSGNVILDHSIVGECKLAADSGSAYGGGLFVVGSLSLVSSAVSDNTAEANTGFGLGGGMFVEGLTDVRYSSVQYNVAKATGANPHGFGGGIVTDGNLYLLGSTIAGNSADLDFGGISVNQLFSGTKTVTVKNSTISGNSAGSLVGGIFTTAHIVNLDNSTIAFNTAAIDRTGAFPNFEYYAPGVSISTNAANVSVTMQSMLIANNTAGASEYDLSAANDTGASTITFSGANNIVRATFVSAPTGTYTKLVCPLLGPLRDNGGPVPTHALLSHSPGIDQGNNVLGLGFDQRGSPYARVSGASADMGAYEVQQGDVRFNSGFETCPTLF